MASKKSLSPAITFLDVDAVMRAGNNKISTQDLSKAHDKVKRQLQLLDSKKGLKRQIADMLSSCLQPLTLSTKAGVLRKQASMRLGLTQGAPL